MGTLGRYVMREIAAPAVLTLVVIAFISVANELRERGEVLPLGLISPWDVGRLIVLFLPTLVSYIIAVTYLVGILLAFGALSQNNEITAMKASGIPMRRLVIPVIIGGGLLSGLAFTLQDRVQPVAMARINEIIYRELPERATLEVLPTGVMHQFGNVWVYIGGRDPKTKTLYNIDIVENLADGQSTVFFAESAQFVRDPEGSRIRLGKGYMIHRSGNQIMPTLFKDYWIPLPAPKELRAPNRRRTWTLGALLSAEKEDTAQLYAFEARLKELMNSGNTDEAQRGHTVFRNQRHELMRLRLEIVERITLPLAALAVSFVAAPLSVRARWGGRSYSFAIGFVIVFVFYLLRMLLEPKSLHPLPDMILRGLVPSIVLCLAGIWALWRVDRV